MSGGYDLKVIIEGNNLKDVALFVSEKLSTLEGWGSRRGSEIYKLWPRKAVN